MNRIIFIFLLFFVFFPTLTQAQDGYIFTKEQHEKIKKNLDELHIKYQSLKREHNDLIFYTLENEKLKKQNESLQRELNYKNKSLYAYKGKYEREHRLNRGDRIIGNAVLGMFIMCGIWGIYVSLEANHGF